MYCILIEIYSTMAERNDLLLGEKVDLHLYTALSDKMIRVVLKLFRSVITGMVELALWQHSSVM